MLRKGIVPFVWTFRELPAGARQWESNWELALEQLPETFGVGADGMPPLQGEDIMSVQSACLT